MRTKSSKRKKKNDLLNEQIKIEKNQKKKRQRRERQYNRSKHGKNYTSWKKRELELERIIKKEK